MARSTGPIIAVGLVTIANETILNDRPLDWRIPIATGISAGFLALLEKVSEPAAVGLAYLALVSITFVRVNKNVPAPTESLSKWLKGK